MLLRRQSQDQKKRYRNKKKIKNRKNRQRRYYSGKKKRHTMKSQVVVSKKSKKIICTDFSNGKKHDFSLLKDSKVHVSDKKKLIGDSGYTGIKKIHTNSEVPKKATKNHPLTKEDKRKNRELSSQRVFNEHVLASLKRFKIISERYRNRCKRFGLRFNLIAGIYNYELAA